MNKYTNREQWLEAALVPIRKYFVAAKYEVPPVRLSCGWPSSRGTSAKKRTIGQAWPGEASSDGIPQIFISPWLVDVCDPQGVLSTLVHELCHATVGNAEKHNKVFGKCARAVGLTGKMTATLASEILVADMKAWAAELGDYPHAKLDLLKSPVKKQTTRMIKMECATCGCIARMAKKWFEQSGPLICPAHGEMSVDKPEDEDDGGEDQE